MLPLFRSIGRTIKPKPLPSWPGSGKGVEIGGGAYVHDNVLIACQLGAIQIGAGTTINRFSARYGAGGIRIGAGCLTSTAGIPVRVAKMRPGFDQQKG